MVKHIITTECSRRCSYCINRNVKIEDCRNMKHYDHKLQSLYSHLSKTHDSIMLTGGEPTLSPIMWTALNIAKSRFKEVHLYSQNPEVLHKDIYAEYFDSIVFSMHDFQLNMDQMTVTNHAIIYCSILSYLYEAGLPMALKVLGYSGLTVNENHFSINSFHKQVPSIPNFSIRINRHGECFRKDTVFIMPDLSIRTSFQEFL
jgi:organic radical activating enzyme